MKNIFYVFGFLCPIALLLITSCHPTPRPSPQPVKARPQNNIVLLNKIHRAKVRIDPTKITPLISKYNQIDIQQVTLSNLLRIKDIEEYQFTDSVQINMETLAPISLMYNTPELNQYCQDLLTLLNESDIDSVKGFYSILSKAMTFYSKGPNNFVVDLRFRSLHEGNITLQEGIKLRFMKGAILQKPYYNFYQMVSNFPNRINDLKPLEIPETLLSGPHVYLFSAPEKYLKRESDENQFTPAFDILENQLKAKYDDNVKCYRNERYCQIYPINGYVTGDMKYIEDVKIELPDVSFYKTTNQFKMFIILSGRYYPGKGKSANRDALKENLQEDFRDEARELERVLAKSIYDSIIR